MAELHRTSQNWHIITSTDPEAVAGVIEELQERQYRTVSAEEYNKIILGADSLATEFAPVFFDRSGVDEQYDPIHAPVFSLDAITICSRAVFTIEPAARNRLPGANAMSFLGLCREYAKSGIQPVDVISSHHSDQADEILRHIQTLDIEEMPHMG